MLILGLAAGAATVFGARKAPLEVTNVEPPYWWTGMACDTLQVMLTGPGIASATASVDYPGVRLVDDVDLDSPNYKLLYFAIAPDAAPGTMDIALSARGHRDTKVPYQLRSRDRAPQDYKGFDASDVLYLLMPDRFAKGLPDSPELTAGLEYAPADDRTDPNARHGGDMKGIADHLDYIDSLGVTAVWVCPVLENDMPGGSYHGYATTNYYRIDPRFGSNEQWGELIEKAHDKGLKVVMDMIFNHCGSNHVWMKKFPASDWFNHQAEFENDGTVTYSNHRLFSIFDPYASDTDRDLTVNGWFTAGMPDLNQKNPHLMNYLIQNSIFWIEDSKIDGIRMDTYPYADMMEMARWSDAVEREYPNFNIVGECWYASDAPNAFWQRDSKVNARDPRLRTVMDFLFVLTGGEFFKEDSAQYGKGLNKLYQHLAIDYLYPDPQHILTFLDNHDTDRFLREAPENLDTWKQALTFLLTSRGIPQLYYGTEVLMHGTRDKGGDPAVRLDMPGGFPGDTTSVFTREGRTPMQNEAYDYLSALLNWRKSPAANPVIARGQLKHFAPVDGVYAYTRTLGDRRVVVFMNGTDRPATVKTSHYREILPDGTAFHNIFTNAPFTPADTIQLAPRATLVLSNF